MEVGVGNKRESKGQKYNYKTQALLNIGNFIKPMYCKVSMTF